MVFVYIILIIRNFQCLNKPTTAMVCTWNCQAAQYWFTVFDMFMHTVLVSIYHQKCNWSILKELGIKLLTWCCTLKTNTQMNICKTNYTYMSLMKLCLMLCIQFEFNLNDTNVEEMMLPTICRLLCNGQNMVFCGGGNLPLHLRL